MSRKISTVEGKIEIVTLADLQIHEKYQRGEKGNRKRIKAAFDPASVGVLHVGRRGDGSLWVIDGQQRRWAMMALGIEKWKAFVIHSSGPQYEAIVFRNINGRNRMGLTQQDLFRAGLEAQDPIALATKRAADAAGITLKVYHGGARNTNKPEMVCVGTLYRMTEKGGEALTTRVLALIVKTWPMQPAAIQELLPNALGKLLHAQGDKIDDERFVRQLEKVPPLKLLNDSAVGMGDRAANCQTLLARHYNKGISKVERLKIFEREESQERENEPEVG